VIEVAGLRKAFAGRTILDGVDVAFAKGEVVALLGPSGAGKSTLLRCLGALDSADAGTITVAGEKLAPGGVTHPENRRALAAVRRHVGFVFQQWHLFLHRTVLGNVVEAPVHVRGVSPADAEAKARALLDRVGLGHRLAAYPQQLSGGEQQRAAIARALAMEPDVLLLDEPTSALDPERVESLLELLRSLAADGMTMIAVTHDERFATKLASRVVTMREGRLAG